MIRCKFIVFGLTLLGFGFNQLFLYVLMRQTIIYCNDRYIEFDQKMNLYAHYQTWMQNIK